MIIVDLSNQTLVVSNERCINGTFKRDVTDNHNLSLPFRMVLKALPSINYLILINMFD